MNLLVVFLYICVFILIAYLIVNTLIMRSEKIRNYRVIDKRCYFHKLWDIVEGKKVRTWFCISNKRWTKTQLQTQYKRPNGELGKVRQSLEYFELIK